MRFHLAAHRRLLFVAAVFLTPTVAHGQLMSKWGHPVVTLGLTPYDAVSTGHGNYPGSNGFIPGYGYYPGDLPGHYPWYDGPSDHHAGQAIGPVSTLVDAVPPGTAVLRVLVAPDADLLIEGQRTTQRGPVRIFVSPPLAEGRRFTYDLLAVWIEDGQERARRQKVQVFPGDRLTIDLQEVRGDTPTPLGPPRPVPER
jgi:uncharacterized protein (TIGR03000 family)